jgi:hypothetical protein
MELLTTVGEQIGCLLMLPRTEPKAGGSVADLIATSGVERSN